MERASVGGRANWAGAAFELRLGVEFCVYILVGDAAGLAPGAARRVQLQAPEPVDDLVLEFETGTRWAIQAKAGPSVRVGWSPDRPFGKALLQLYQGATSGQIDTAPDSLDRVVLAVDHRAHPSVTRFGGWLDTARQHHDWEHFEAASTGPELEWAQKLPAFLNVDPGDDLLAFLRRLYVRRAPAPDPWWSELRGRLIVAGVPDSRTAGQILGIILAQVAEAAPHAGQLDYDDLRRACETISGCPRRGVPAFRILRNPTEDDLYRALKMPPVRPGRFVERSELNVALASEQGVLVAGRPGSGKSHALIKLALARPERPVVVVAGHFRADDLGRLAAGLRRVHTPYQILWDDVHDKPGPFADAVQRLVERGDDVRVLAAYRDQHEPNVRERVTPDLCRRAGLPSEPLRLRPFNDDQAAQMASAVVEALDLGLDADARDAFARHIERGDGGPLFALSTGLLLQEREAQGERVHAADVTGLPDRLLDIWQDLYRRLAGRPNGVAMQNLVDGLHFLHRIGCPLQVRLSELLFTQVLGLSRGDFGAAARTLAQEGWLRREEDAFAAHDVTLEAVPEEADSFHDFAQFAREEVEGEQLALGLLRGSLSLYHQRRLPYMQTARQRRSAATEAVELGELTIADFRAIGHTVHLGTVLNNTSSCYSDLAGLEETRQGRIRLLEQAVAAIEEAARLYRDLGLRADLAMALGTANLTYRAVAEAADSPEEQIPWLRKALESIEEAVEHFRATGVVRYLIQALRDCVICHFMLAERSGELDRAHVLALCQEGEYSAARWRIRKAWPSSARSASSWTREAESTAPRAADCRFADLTHLGKLSPNPPLRGGLAPRTWRVT